MRRVPYRHTVLELPDKPVNCRGKDFACTKCNQLCHVLADMDTGKLLYVEAPAGCHTKAVCLETTIRGIWDRQFGARLIVPVYSTPS